MLLGFTVEIYSLFKFVCLGVMSVPLAWMIGSIWKSAWRSRR